MWPLLVLVFQTLFAYTSGEKATTVIASLLGMKPLFDTYNFVTGKEKQRANDLDNAPKWE